LMLTNYPTSIVVHGLAFNVTVQSYNRSLDFGLMADAHAMPDVAEFAEALHVAFDDLRSLPLPEEVAAEADAEDGFVKRTGRSLAGAVSGAVSGAMTGAMGKVAERVVRGAVDAAVTKATGRTRASAPAKRARRR